MDLLLSSHRLVSTHDNAFRIGLSKDGDESFFARVNILKDKVRNKIFQ